MTPPPRPKEDTTAILEAGDFGPRSTAERHRIDPGRIPDGPLMNIISASTRPTLDQRHGLRRPSEVRRPCGFRRPSPIPKVATTSCWCGNSMGHCVLPGGHIAQSVWSLGLLAAPGRARTQKHKPDRQQPCPPPMPHHVEAALPCAARPSAGFKSRRQSRTRSRRRPSRASARDTKGLAIAFRRAGIGRPPEPRTSAAWSVQLTAQA